MKELLPTLLNHALPSKVVVKPDVLLPCLFSDNIIFGGVGRDHHGLSIEKFLEHCEEKDILTSSQTSSGRRISWPSCPDLTVPSQEASFAGFLGQLASEVQDYATCLIKRVWSADFKEHSLPGVGSSNRPDIVCADMLKPVDCRNIRTILELKSGNNMTPNEIFRSCVQCARLIFSTQDTRRFVVVLLLHQYQLTVAFFDRGGSIVSQPFDIRSHPDLFARVVLAFACADLTGLGYGTSLSDEPRIDRLLVFHGLQLQIRFTAFISDSMHGRGTVIWLGKVGKISDLSEVRQQANLKLDQPVVIKTSWVDDASVLTEGTVLALLAQKGVQGIPTLIYEDFVPPPSTDDGVSSDGTAYTRAKLGLSAGGDNDNCDSVSLSKEATKAIQTMAGGPYVEGFAPRTPVRMVTKPWATPLTQFRSARELLGIFVDVLNAHFQASSPYNIISDTDGQPVKTRFQILHRDTSPMNIGMVPQIHSSFPAVPNRGDDHRGLLFDWGCAAVSPTTEPEDEVCDLSDDEARKVEWLIGESDVSNYSTSMQIPQMDEIAPNIKVAGNGDLDDEFMDILEVFLEVEEHGAGITGTRPFIAVELLKAFEDKTSQSPIHGIHHDLESFFLVLVAICVWFDAPHHPKPIYQFNAGTTTTAGLPSHHFVVRWLFMDEVDHHLTAVSRLATFSSPIMFEQDILNVLSPYFRHLKPSLRQLRQLIYGDRADTYLNGLNTRPTHEAMVNILEAAIQSLPPLLAKHRTPLEAVARQYPPVSELGVWDESANPPDIYSLQLNCLQLPGHQFLDKSQTNEEQQHGGHVAVYPKAPFLFSRVPYVPSTQKKMTSSSQDLLYTCYTRDRKVRLEEIESRLKEGTLSAKILRAAKRRRVEKVDDGQTEHSSKP